jgi:hypothetical protein
MQGELATTARWEAEALVAVDVPIGVGFTNMTVGLAGGGGMVHSARSASTTTFGPRIEAHVACAFALGHGIAADVTVAGGAAPDAPTTPYRRGGAMYPAEPAALLRVALGFRMDLR